jgi:hypothetical protein
MRQSHRVEGKPVDYIRIEELSDKGAEEAVWPFLKRLPYAHEEEYRMIAGSCEKSPPKEITFLIPKRCLKSIRLNPLLNIKQASNLSAYLTKECEKHGWPNVAIFKSGVLESKQWLDQVAGLIKKRPRAGRNNKA